MCNCPDPAVQRTVNKASAHQGRKFWTCPKPQGEQCGFFVSPSSSSTDVHESREDDDERCRNGRRTAMTQVGLWPDRAGRPVVRHPSRNRGPR
jgi:hypothetical protein